MSIDRSIDRWVNERRKITTINNQKCLIDRYDEWCVARIFPYAMPCLTVKLLDRKFIHHHHYIISERLSQTNRTDSLQLARHWDLVTLNSQYHYRICPIWFGLIYLAIDYEQSTYTKKTKWPKVWRRRSKRDVSTYRYICMPDIVQHRLVGHNQERLDAKRRMKMLVQRLLANMVVRSCLLVVMI